MCVQMFVNGTVPERMGGRLCADIREWFVKIVRTGIVNGVHGCS